MTAADRLDEIEARANAATTGPWSHCLDELRNRTAVHRIGSSEVNADVAFTYRDRDGRGPGMQDAEFIAHSRTDVPRMVAALRAVLDVCDGLEEAHRANPKQTYEYGLEEAAHQVRNAVEAALREVAS